MVCRCRSLFCPWFGWNSKAALKETVSDNNVVEYNFNRDIVFKKNPQPDAQETVYMRPMEIGLNVTGGYQFKKGLLFNASYSRGLSSIWNNGNKQVSTYIGVSVGYFFSRSKYNKQKGIDTKRCLLIYHNCYFTTQLNQTNNLIVKQLSS